MDFENKNFYPTPKNIIEKMLENVDLKKINTILEPSAGSGNIVDYLMEYQRESNKYYRATCTYQIDCIEIEPDLQSVLKGKNYHVVFDDFLNYNTYKEYDLIIANVPFSNDVKHLIKILEMQKRNGGAAIVLCNAETIKNPYSNDRIHLKRLLDEYNANIEFIQNAFTTAERKTDVEIALIKVQLPEVLHESIILEKLHKAQEYEDKVYNNDGQIIEKDFIKSIIKQYELECKAGIDLINEYNAMKPFILSKFDKDKQTGKTIQTGGCTLFLAVNTRNGKNNVLTINDYLKEIRRKYWLALFHNEEFIGKLTNNMRQEFYKKIDSLIEYDFNEFNIKEIKNEMNKHVVSGIEETIMNLFEELSYKHYYEESSKNIHYYNGWTTNKAWKINDKNIIPLNAYSNYNNSFRPTDYKIINKFKDIEKCLNFLDDGTTEYINIEDTLKFAEENDVTKNIVTKYFDITFYKKGTCHIKWTNKDILKKFNIFAGKKYNWLPYDYGKKYYSDMNDEEKNIINEFDGSKEEYTRVVSRNKYFLVNLDRTVLLESK